MSQLIIQIFLPAFLVYQLLRLTKSSSLNRHLVVAYSALAMIYVFVASRWDVTSTYLRYFWVIALIYAIYKAYRTILDSPDSNNAKFATYSNIAIVVVAGYLAFSALSGLVRPSGAVSISSPLKGGDNYIAHGGSSTGINYHHPNKAQAYALDVGKVNKLGHQTSISKNLDAYEIFSSDIMSPCDGTVVQIRDGLVDQVPPNRDKDKANIAGNHVVIQCNGVKILLAHMQAGSIQVNEGENVTTGRTVGKVGNSGNTTQPHLHMHAVRDNEDIMKGAGVPLLINGQYLVRNNVF